MLFYEQKAARFRESETFRRLFDDVVRRCMAAGLVKGEGFAVDASIVAADASAQREEPGEAKIDWADPVLSTRIVHE